MENNNKNYVNLYHLIKSNVMPAATMFSKFKSGNPNPQNPIDSNPISQYFEISKSDRACAGPELIWKIFEAYRKSDGKVISCQKQLSAPKSFKLSSRLSLDFDWVD